MKIFWIWFKNTRFWEEELCVTILAENQEQAIAKLLEWKEKTEWEEGEDYFEDVSFSVENLNIRYRDIEPPFVMRTTWD